MLLSDVGPSKPKQQKMEIISTRPRPQWERGAEAFAGQDKYIQNWEETGG